MPNYNSIQLIGHVGQIKEAKLIGDKLMLPFTLAVASGYGDKKATTWFDVNAWGRTAEFLQNTLQVGATVMVVGPHTMREVPGDRGEKRRFWTVNANTVELLREGRSDQDGSQAGQSQRGPMGAARNVPQGRQGGHRGNDQVSRGGPPAGNDGGDPGSDLPF